MQDFCQKNGRTVFSVFTLFEILQVAELHQIIAIVVVCNVDLVVFGHWVFHPGSFIPSIAVLLLWHLH